MSVLFTYNTQVLELRNPQLQDSDLGLLGTAYHIAMSGKVRAYRKTPERRRWLLNFTELDCKDIDEIISFILASSGKLIFFQDWQGVIHTGYTVNNPMTLQKSARSRTEFVIEFELAEEEDLTYNMLTQALEVMAFEDDEPMLYEG